MISLLAAISLFTMTNLLYAEYRGNFFSSDAPPVYSFASLVLIASATAFLAVAALMYLKTAAVAPVELDNNSKLVVVRLTKIVSNAIFRGWKLVLLSGVVYAVFFAFLQGILIYQPNTDFASAYGVSHASAQLLTCCGPPGYVPIGLVYLPAQHFGIQLIPISILIMILISTLVGLNVSLLYLALNTTRSQTKPTMPLQQGQTSTPSTLSKKVFASGGLGAAFGLFAGCPTCAASFFLSMIAGSGATIFSAAISKYQPVIIGLTVPLLLGSILLQAKSIRTFLRGCST
jgi:hypothetical protein